MSSSFPATQDELNKVLVAGMRYLIATQKEQAARSTKFQEMVETKLRYLEEQINIANQTPKNIAHRFVRDNETRVRNGVSHAFLKLFPLVFSCEAMKIEMAQLATTLIGGDDQAVSEEVAKFLWMRLESMRSNLFRPKGNHSTSFGKEVAHLLPEWTGQGTQEAKDEAPRKFVLSHLQRHNGLVVDQAASESFKEAIEVWRRVFAEAASPNWTPGAVLAAEFKDRTEGQGAGNGAPGLRGGAPGGAPGGDAPRHMHEDAELLRTFQLIE